MNEIFDKIKDGAYKAKDGAERIAKVVAKRTSEAITHTKLAFAVNEANNTLRDMYTEIGKTMYEKYLDGEPCGEEMLEQFERIDKQNAEIEMLNEKLAELKKSLKCPECGAYNSEDADFCSKCGAALEVRAEDFETEVTVEADEDDVVDIAEEDEVPAEEPVAGEEDEEDVIIINPKKPE